MLGFKLDVMFTGIVVSRVNPVFKEDHSKLKLTTLILTLYLPIQDMTTVFFLNPKHPPPSSDILNSLEIYFT